MGARSRVWRVGKWVGVVLSVVLAGTFVASFSYGLGYVSTNGLSVGVLFGEVYFGREQVVDSGKRYIVSGTDATLGTGWEFTTQPWIGWHFVEERLLEFPYTWEYGDPAIERVYCVPLWIPFAIVVIPTTLLWYRDWRRIAAGHCQKCGYDLTRNESGRCPECGVVCGQSTVKKSTVKIQGGDEVVRPPDGESKGIATRD